MLVDHRTTVGYRNCLRHARRVIIDSFHTIMTKEPEERQKIFEEIASSIVGERIPYWTQDGDEEGKQEIIRVFREDCEEILVDEVESMVKRFMPPPPVPVPTPAPTPAPRASRLFQTFPSGNNEPEITQKIPNGNIQIPEVQPIRFPEGYVLNPPAEPAPTIPVAAATSSKPSKSNYVPLTKASMAKHAPRQSEEAGHDQISWIERCAYLRDDGKGD